MQIVERESKTVNGYALEVISRGRGTFQSKELRDAVCKLIKLHGHTPVRRRTTGQQLHPQYVTDYVGTLEIGFGNSMYQTYFSKLYLIDVKRSHN